MPSPLGVPRPTPPPQQAAVSVEPLGLVSALVPALCPFYCVDNKCVCACSVSPTLCDYVDCSLPGSSVHGISQARILEWVGISSSRDLPDPGIEPRSPVFPALAGGLFTTVPPGSPTDTKTSLLFRALAFTIDLDDALWSILQTEGGP